MWQRVLNESNEDYFSLLLRRSRYSEEDVNGVNVEDLSPPLALGLYSSVDHFSVFPIQVSISSTFYVQLLRQ